MASQVLPDELLETTGARPIWVAPLFRELSRPAHHRAAGNSAYLTFTFGSTDMPGRSR